MNVFLVILLVCVGILLLVAELYLLPGFGVAGIGGFSSLVGGVCLAYYRISTMAGHITLILSIVLTLLAIYLFYRSRAIEKMALDTTIEGSVGLADPGKKIKELEKEAEEMDKH